MMRILRTPEGKYYVALVDDNGEIYDSSEEFDNILGAEDYILAEEEADRIWAQQQNEE